MDALVGYGLSSDSDSDASDEQHSESLKRSTQGEVRPDKPVKSRNFLLEADSGSASSGSEAAADDEEDKDEERPPALLPRDAPLPPAVNKLPPPSLQTCSDTSVFTNPFKAQADRKLCALQKHVPLTEQARPSHIGGRRVCVSYRKDGRCRFGIKCKYAHDSDLQTQPTDCPPQTGQEAHPGARGTRGFVRDAEEKPEGQKGTKRRVGLSNTLIPPKRAMKQYAMQREKEGGHI